MIEFQYAQQLYQELERFKKAGHSAEETESFFRQNKPNYFPKRTSLIAVISQKGGNGKSTFATNFSLGLGNLGIYKVGLLDLDILDPNDKKLLSTELEYMVDGIGCLTSILTKELTGSKYGITEEEKKEILKKGQVADFLYGRMATTKDPKIYTLFSDIPSRLDKKKDEVYQEIFSLFTRASAYKSKMDFLVCDFGSGSMSDPNIAELMRYFDYRLMVVVPNEVGIEGIKTAIDNDINEEYQRQTAENVLILNRVKSEMMEQFTKKLSEQIPTLKGKGTNEAEAFLNEVRTDLSSVLKLDHGAIIFYDKKMDQDLFTRKILKPAILNGRPIDYCREVDKVINFTINSTIKKRVGGTK